MVLLITLRIIRARNTSLGLVGNSVPVLLHLVQFQFARVVAGRPDLTGGPLLAANVLYDIALRDVWIDVPGRGSQHQERRRFANAHSASGAVPKGIRDLECPSPDEE